MSAAIILLNFGEPERPTEAEVIPFLERIFATNASLEGDATAEQVRERSRWLAEQRAPGLMEEYREIGGSPLNRQAAEQAEALAVELGRRGHDVRTYVGMQFTEPSIRTAAERARAAGADRLIGLPIYPLCGPSTTVAALETLATEVRDLGWEVPVHEVTGWHTHPLYTALRADAIRACARNAGIDLADATTRLVFSAHGTPLKYLREGSRYDLYVEDSCRRIAAELGIGDYVIGYQNHTNRPIEWTQPDIEDVLRRVEAERVVVVPLSFMHEQSETLAELDGELREGAEEAGLEFYRVPIPHDDARFAALLADLVEPFLDGRPPAERGLGRCRCRPGAGAVCLNASLRR